MFNALVQIYSGPTNPFHYDAQMWLPMTSPASQDVPAVIQTLRSSNKENGGMMKHQTEEGDYPLCTWGLPDRGLSGMDKQARRNIGCPIEVSLTVAEVFVCLSGPRMQLPLAAPYLFVEKSVPEQS